MFWIRRSSRVTAMEDEEEYADEDEDESESESDYDEDDEEEPQPKKARVLEICICIYWSDCGLSSRLSRRPRQQRRRQQQRRSQPAAKPAKTRDDWIAKGFDAEAVDTAMEARPVLDTKSEIWDAMLERFKFWMVICLLLR